MKDNGDFEFLNKILGFGYIFNVFKILPISKKYWDFPNWKLRAKCTKIQKVSMKNCFYRSLAVECHVSNSHHKEANVNGKSVFI